MKRYRVSMYKEPYTGGNKSVQVTSEYPGLPERGEVVEVGGVETMVASVQLIGRPYRRGDDILLNLSPKLPEVQSSPPARPLCVDCRWCREDVGVHQCYHPVLGSLVTGEIVQENCSTERYTNKREGACGAEGRNFEPKENDSA